MEKDLINLIDILYNNKDIDNNTLTYLVNNYHTYKKSNPNSRYVKEIDKYINSNLRKYNNLIYLFLNTKNRYLTNIYYYKMPSTFINIRYVMMLIYNNKDVLQLLDTDLIKIYVNTYFKKGKDRFDELFYSEGYYSGQWVFGYKPIHARKMPKDPKTIEDDFNNDYKDKYNEGYYGELIVYRMLKQHYDNVIWVSKDIGDGAGYDLMAYDDSRMNVKLFEVKTSFNCKEPVPEELSDNERRVFDETLDDPNTSYTIYTVRLFGKLFYEVKSKTYHEKTHTI